MANTTNLLWQIVPIIGPMDIRIVWLETESFYAKLHTFSADVTAPKP